MYYGYPLAAVGENWGLALKVAHIQIVSPISYTGYMYLVEPVPRMVSCALSTSGNQPHYSDSMFLIVMSFSSSTVPITYVEADGTEKLVQAEIGRNLMDVAHANNIELEGTVSDFLAVIICYRWRAASASACSD
jgi:hypothetical protein